MLHQDSEDHVSVRQMLTGWVQEVVDVANALALGFGYAVMGVGLLLLLVSVF